MNNKENVILINYILFIDAKYSYDTINSIVNILVLERYNFYEKIE